MNIILFIATIVISFIAIRIGAIAFQLTGLEWSLATFQSLSCFTGTGFTTREAELIVGNPQRRRIASALMVLGNAGLVTLIATFANTLRPSTYLPKITIPFLDLVFPSRLLPWINLTIVIIAIYALYKVFTHSRFTQKITNVLRARLIKKEIIKPVSFEELLVATGGYGLTNIEITDSCPIADKSLIDSQLRGHGITVLTVERKGEIIPNPSKDTKLLLGDKLTCFGKLDHIRQEFGIISPNKQKKK